jgi:hypothetical protein
MKTPMIITAVAMATVMFAGNLSAQTALANEAEITEGLIAAGQAYEISEKCGAISARSIRGAFFLNGLRIRATELGYSNSQIETYIDDRAEQRRLEGIARTRLFGKGAVAGQEQTYCAVGRAEIAAGSQIGRLLY